MQVNAFLDDDDHHLALPERTDVAEDARADLMALSDEPVQPLLPLHDTDNDADDAADAPPPPPPRKPSKAPMRRIMPRLNDSDDDDDNNNNNNVPAPTERAPVEREPVERERVPSDASEPANVVPEQPTLNVNEAPVNEAPVKAAPAEKPKRKKRVVVDAGGVSDFELISRLLADAGGDDGAAETHALVDTQDHADA
jgi:N-acetylmuramoyl-L-alanine amidase